MIKNKQILKLANLLLEILVVGILLGAFYPFAKWFYQANPPMGMDFYQFPTYVRYLGENWAMPPSSWKYIWFDGVPTINDYSALFFYLAIPFAKIWGLVMGSKVFLLSTTFLYFLFSYFLLKELAKSRLFALAVAVGLIWTTNFYSPLVMGGNATFAATQFFLSLVLWLIVKYYRTGKRKFFFLSIFFAGLSYWGHAGTALIFVWVPALLLLSFWRDRRVKLISGKKIKDIFFYILASAGIGFLPLYSIVYLILTIPKAANFNFFQAGGIAHLGAIKGLFLTQNVFLSIGAVILFALVFAGARPKNWRKFTPFAVLALYIIVFELLYVVGRNPFAGGIMPPRTYWFFTIIITALAAVSWDSLFHRGKKLEFTTGTLKITSFSIQVAVVVIVFLSPFGTIADLNRRILKINPAETGVATNFRDYAIAQSTLGEKILGNSIFLEKYNVDDILAQENITETDKEKLKGRLIPTWLDTNELNYRFHTLEVGVNIWWSALFDLPITHGSYNSAHFESNNYTYWTDMVFHGELTTHWDHPLLISKNDLLFLIDWRGVRYLLGNEVEVKESTKYSLGQSIGGPSSIATYLTQDPNLIDRRGIEGVTEGELTFFRIKKEVVSPIIKTTNAPTLLVIGETQTAYENLLRNLGHLNLNSRYLVPVKGPVSLSEVSLGDLKKFDIVFLQYYQSNISDWKKVEKYVKEGGNLVVETGSEVRESDTGKQTGNKELPTVFPMGRTTRGPLGQDWSLSFSSSDPLLNGVNPHEFGSLKYNDDPWNISYTDPSSIRDWAHAILKQEGKPFVIAGQLGQGKVVWSGLNLSYHYNQYFSQAEGRLIRNILSSMIDLRDEGTLNFEMTRPKSEKIVVEGNNFKGVVLKENNYGGWSAKMVLPYKKGLKVYNAGLGYSYVQLPKDVTGPAKVEFKYQGTLFNWFFFLLAVIISVWLIMKSTVGTRKLVFLEKINIFGLIKKRFNEKVMSWWHTEDDE